MTSWEEVAERHFPAYRARRTTFQGQRRLQEFLPLVGIDPAAWSDDHLDEVFADYERACRAAWRAFDAMPCLAALEGLAAMAVLSNGDQTQQHAKVSQTGLGRHVGTVLTSEGLGVAEPDPRAFTAACSILGVRPRDAWYVGDRLQVDAVAASAAGLRGVWLDRSGTEDGSGLAGIAVFHSLAGLPDLLALGR